MNNYSVLLFILSLLFTTNLLSKSLEIDVKLLDWGEPHLYEPLFFEIRISNNTRKKIIVHSPETAGIFVREKGTHHWKMIGHFFHDEDVNSIEGSSHKRIALEAGTNAIVYLGVNTPYWSIRNKSGYPLKVVLSPEKEYEFKLAMDEVVVESGRKWESSIFSIGFHQPPEEYLPLLETPYPNLCIGNYYASIPEEYREVLRIKATATLEKYPDSILADWARLYFFNEHFYDFRQTKDSKPIWDYYNSIYDKIKHPRIMIFLEAQKQEWWYVSYMMQNSETKE